MKGVSNKRTFYSKAVEEKVKGVSSVEWKTFQSEAMTKAPRGNVRSAVTKDGQTNYPTK